MISRDEWNAKPPKAIEKFKGAAPFVFIHHSYIPKACLTTADCLVAMQSMQRSHQKDNGWNDIGYR